MYSVQAGGPYSTYVKKQMPVTPALERGVQKQEDPMCLRVASLAEMVRYKLSEGRFAWKQGKKRQRRTPYADLCPLRLARTPLPPLIYTQRKVLWGHSGSKSKQSTVLLYDVLILKQIKVKYLATWIIDYDVWTSFI